MNSLRFELMLLPERLGPHLALVLLSLGAGIALSAPLALISVRVAAMRWAVLTVAGVAQTIPGLALLALMVPLLDGLRSWLGGHFSAVGFLPAVLALTLYSVLPILRNAVTGLRGVDAAVIESAVSLGLTRAQVLLQVQLPLAAPVILAGIRTSAVWTVGTATLSTPVGQTSLGNYIFAGLQTRNWVSVLVGCGATAILALTIDLALGLLEKAAKERHRAPLFLGLAMLGSLVVLSVVLAPRHAQQGAPRQVRIGTKNFTEQYILADALAASLRDEGFDASPVEGLGSTVLFDALVRGEIDVAIDYSGTIWANQLKRSEVASPDVVSREVASWLDREHGVLSLGSLGFENSYCFALSRARAQALGISSLQQLAGPDRAMRVGSDYEFFSRPEWKRVAATYGLAPKALVSFDPSLMYEAVKSGDVDVITAFSTDGRINAFGLTVLDDPLHALPPYDALILVGPKARADRHLVEVLTGWVNSLDVETMRSANQLVDTEGKSRAEAARFLLGARRVAGGRSRLSAP